MLERRKFLGLVGAVAAAPFAIVQAVRGGICTTSDSDVDYAAGGGRRGPERVVNLLLGQYMRRFETPPDWLSLPKPFWEVFGYPICPFTHRFRGHSVKVYYNRTEAHNWQGTSAAINGWTGPRVIAGRHEQSWPDGHQWRIAVQEWRVDPSIWETRE